MTLQALNAALAYPPRFGANGTVAVGTTGAITIDAAGEYIALVIIARQAMTISHVGVGVTTATGSPTADIRIETVDASGMPSGTLWATNTNLVTGALSTGFTLHALTASASIAAGQRFCVKVLYNSGTTIGLTRLNNVLWEPGLPYGVFNTGTPTKQSSSSFTYHIAWVLGSSTTSFYRIPGLVPATAFSANAYNNTGGDRRGIRFRVPFKSRMCGILDWPFSSTGDFDYSLYDDAGSEIESTSMDGDHMSNASSDLAHLFFDTPQELQPNTWYRAVRSPTSATNITLGVMTLPSANHLGATGWGVGNAHYTTFTTGGGWVDSATDQVPVFMRLLLDQLDDGVGAGGGVSRARVFGGF